MSISKVSYKGIDIFLVDYSKCENVLQKQMRILREVGAIIGALPNNSGAYLVSDVSTQKATIEFMTLAKKLNKEIFQHKVSGQAVIGVSGIQKILLTGYNAVARLKTLAMDSKEEAFEHFFNERLKRRTEFLVH